MLVESIIPAGNKGFLPTWPGVDVNGSTFCVDTLDEGGPLPPAGSDSARNRQLHGECRLDFLQFTGLKVQFRSADHALYLFRVSHSNNGTGSSRILERPCDRGLARCPAMASTDLGQQLRQP